MSVTSNDLKSMLSRVRKADSVPMGTKPKPQAPPSAPPAARVATAPAPSPAAATPPPAAPPEESKAQPAEEFLEIGVIDQGAILGEIMKDEELMINILGILYRAKKKSPNGGAVAIMPMEQELGIERESAAFVLNYLRTKHYIEADDKSRNLITIEGLDFLRSRLTAKP